MKKIFQLVDRIKYVLSLKTDGEVADALNMSNTALSNHKRRGSIPYEPISTLCEDRGISFDWLFTGEGPERRVGSETDSQPVEDPASADPKFADLVKKLEAIYEEGSRKDRAEIRGMIEETYDEIMDVEKKPEGVVGEEPVKKAGNH